MNTSVVLFTMITNAMLHTEILYIGCKGIEMLKSCFKMSMHYIHNII